MGVFVSGESLERDEEAGFVVGGAEEHGELGEVTCLASGEDVGEYDDLVDGGTEGFGDEAAGVGDGGEDAGVGFCAHAG